MIRLQRRGRLTTAADTELPPGHQDYEHLQAMQRLMPRWHARRSAFAAPRLLRQLIRGGCEGPCRDFDLARSFPSMILARHPAMSHIRQYVEDPQAAAQAAGVTLTALKDIINSAAGCGQRRVQAWLSQHGLTAPPQWVKEYLEQVRAAALADYCIHPELAAQLKQMGFNEHEVINRLHYILNAEQEREVIDNAVDATRDVAEVCSFECDGLVLIPLQGTPNEAWERECLSRLESVGNFVLKLTSQSATCFSSLPRSTRWRAGTTPTGPGEALARSSPLTCPTWSMWRCTSPAAPPSAAGCLTATRPTSCRRHWCSQRRPSSAAAWH